MNSQASCEHKDKTSKENVVQQETQRWPVTTMSSWQTDEGALTRHGFKCSLHTAADSSQVQEFV